METWSEAMRDAAYAENLDGWDGVHGGYPPVGYPFNAWETSQWLSLAGIKKLPIVEMPSPGDEKQAEQTAEQMLAWLETMSVPLGAPTVLAVETAVNPPWVTRYGLVMNEEGYKVWVYGSTDTLFDNPQLNGYWVASPAENGQPYMYERPGSLVRATQYRENVNDEYDSSTVKRWTLQHAKWWK